MACGTLVAQSRIKPTSLALEGGFLATGLPGKYCPPSFSLGTPILLYNSLETAGAIYVHLKDIETEIQEA